MPIYEYQCLNCKQRFELKQGYYDKTTVDCPVCKGIAHRLFSAVPIVFKGSGFYITDSRKKGTAPKDS
jgi:putative FmdB family regulatory protein